MSTRINCGGDASSSSGAQFFDNPWPLLVSAGVQALYASWLHGSGWPGGSTVALADGADISRNGRDLQVLGSFTVASKSSTPTGRDNCYVAPFTLNQVIASGASAKSAALLSVCKIPASVTGSNGFILGDYDTNATSQALGFTSSNMVNGFVKAGSSTAATIANDSSHGTVFALHCMTFDDSNADVYYIYNATPGNISTKVKKTGTVAIPGAPIVLPGTGLLKVGGYYDSAGSPFDNNIQVVSSAVYNAKLSSANMDTIHASLTSWLLSKSAPY